MNKPFKSFQYDIEVITPLHIGAAKESEYILGQDYFFEDGCYHFVDTRKIMKELTAQQLEMYTTSLLNFNDDTSSKILSEVADKNESVIIYSSYCPFKPIQQSIKKHISDGMGNLIIPGSSLKGAISGIIGKQLMKLTGQNTFDSNILFGRIQNSLMRYLQVGDATFNVYGEVTLQKIFSADLIDRYNNRGNQGAGMWKHERRGGHGEQFNTKGFVTAAEMLIEESVSECRINWADGLLEIIPNNLLHQNMRFFELFSKENMLKIIRDHTEEYLKQEIHFFTSFPNEDFDDVIEILNNLIHVNKTECSALIRLGAGSGYHAITGNWRFSDHTSTFQAEDRNGFVNAINYKTRKVAFYRQNDEIKLSFPGFIKLTAK